MNASFDLSLHPKLSQTSRPPEYTHLCTIMINAFRISHRFCKNITYDPIIVFRALVDTGPWGSATCHKELIMTYIKYTSSFHCSVRFTGAITEDNAVSNFNVSHGEGYILVPLRFQKFDYVRVKVYYSPHLTSTIINEEDLM